jgi:hypothetical protein
MLLPLNFHIAIFILEWEKMWGITFWATHVRRENSGFINIWQEQPVLYMKTTIHFLSYLAHFFLEWEMFLTNVCTENQNTNFMFNYFFPPEIRAVYEIMWENSVQPGRPQMTIWRMRIVCWITGSKRKLGIWNITAFPHQQFSHERPSMLCHAYSACFVTL